MDFRGVWVLVAVFGAASALGQTPDSLRPLEQLSCSAMRTQLTERLQKALAPAQRAGVRLAEAAVDRLSAARQASQGGGEGREGVELLTHVEQQPLSRQSWAALAGLSEKSSPDNVAVRRPVLVRKADGSASAPIPLYTLPLATSVLELESPRQSPAPVSTGLKLVLPSEKDGQVRILGDSVGAAFLGVTEFAREDRDQLPAFDPSHAVDRPGRFDFTGVEVTSDPKTRETVVRYSGQVVFAETRLESRGRGLGIKPPVFRTLEELVEEVYLPPVCRAPAKKANEPGSTPEATGAKSKKAVPVFTGNEGGAGSFSGKAGKAGK